jgi:murein DD-endopeptidase MepM/ murein hydrolase activator NlpD
MSAVTRRTTHEPRRQLAGASSRARPPFATVAIVAIVTAALTGPVPVVAAPCWQPPVAAAVADPFRQPDCPWCPGNRGVEYATTAGDPVTSVAAGTVTFAGSIVGIRYVVVEIANQWRITYGNLLHLSGSEIRVGAAVVAGMAIGAAAGPFHFGARDGDMYIDPAPYLGEWQFRVRLVPTNGARPAPAPPPTLRCGTDGSGGFARTVPERDSPLRR